jgi:hypothetical protein
MKNIILTENQYTKIRRSINESKNTFKRVQKNPFLLPLGILLEFLYLTKKSCKAFIFS